MLELFIQHKKLWFMYYVGIGAAYPFGLAALMSAIHWW